MASADDFVLVAAIDFGTTFSGYAFSFKATKDDPALHENIRMNTNWGQSLGFQSHKTPTSVLTNKAGEFLAFGYEAEQQYSAALEEDEAAATDMLLFRHFKMRLNNKEDVKRTALITSIDGTIFPAIDIFAHAIKYLKDQLIKTLQKETGRTLDVSLIRWVITVPAIWSDESKQFMREAAYKSGCASSKHPAQLLIALEPEAASVCCRRLNIAQYSNPTGVSFHTGTKYLVLDCGGGTVDITAHSVEPDDTVKELAPPSGGPWGGTQVDKNFTDFLCTLLGTNFMNTYQQKFPQEWLMMINQFDKVKKSFIPDGKSRISIPMPWEMGSLYAELNGGKKLDRVLKEKADHGVGFATGSMIIKHEAARKLFDPVTSKITQHLKQLLKDSKLKGLDYIMMVGGFSECVVLQEAMQSAFGGNGLKILVPSEAQLAILKGAVLYGHNPEEISKRLARYTYGGSISLLFDPSNHNPQFKFVNELGKERCGRIFNVYVEKGEEIKIGEKREYYTYTPTNDNTEHCKTVYALDGLPAKPLQYVTDPKVKRIGQYTYKTPVAAKQLNREIKTTIEFGGTEIKIEAEFVATGEKGSTTINCLHD